MFSPPSNYSERRLWAGAFFATALTIICVPWSGQDEGIVPPDMLRTATGTITLVTNHRYGVKFRLEGIDKTFNYPSKARGNGIVLNALEGAGERNVTVLYNPNPRRPILRNEQLYDAWQIAVDHAVRRSFEESASGWRSDNAIRPWLAAFFAFCAIYFCYFAIKKRRNYGHL